MTALIGNFIADAAMSAIRGQGSGEANFHLRPSGRQVPAPRKGGAPVVLGLTLIKIVVNFGR